MNIKKILLFFTIIFLLAPLRAQHAKYDLDLRVEPVYVSPNGDGIQDIMFFYPVSSSNSSVTSWRLIINTAKGKKTQRLEGKNLPALLKWDGKTKKDTVVAPGAYTATLQAKGSGFNLISSAQSFFVDNVVPVVTLSVSTTVLDQSVLNDQVLTFTPTVQDASPVDRWQLQVLDQTGRTVYVNWGTGTVRDIAWDGKDKETHVLVPLGPYKALFQAWDMAGNASEPASVDLRVNVSAREMLMAVLKIISVHETEIGLIVQLKKPPIFTFDDGKPVLTSVGEAAMREVAILANAYSQAPVRLDGYSRALTKADRDRDMGSLYAWNVYSYLVKKGNVKASRIQVRGRGRSAMFNRRGAGVPVLTDGVEVILEGSGNW